MSNRALEALERISVDPPKGRYLVELQDRKTRKVTKWESPNYITDAHYRAARYLQAFAIIAEAGILLTGGRFYNTLHRANGNLWGVNPFAGPPSPHNAIVATDYAGAEVQADAWLRGNIIAYATKYKRTIPASGPAGLVNEAENSYSSNMRVWTHVYDWSTQQGNGTFQTLAMGSVGSTVAAHLFSQFASGNTAKLLNQTGLGVVEINPGVGCQDPDNGDYYHLAFLALSGTNPRILKWTSAQVDSTALVDGSGKYTADSGSATIQATFNTTTWPLTSSAASSTSHYYLGHFGMAKMPSGGDFLTFGYQNNGVVRVGRQTPTGTNVYSNSTTGAAALGTAAQTFSSGFVTGGKLYAVMAPFSTSSDLTTNPNASRVLRFDPATGNFEAYINLPAGDIVTGQCCWDGTNMFIATTKGIKVYDLAGTPVSPFNIGAPMGYPGSSLPYSTAEANWTFSTVSPEVSASNTATASWNNPQFPFQRRGLGLVSNDVSTAGNSLLGGTRAQVSPPTASSPNISANLQSNQGYMGQMQWRNSRLWFTGLVSGSIISTGFVANLAVGFFSADGHNMSSRTLLGSPVTKNSSQTMKITYELTLPVDWWEPIPHPNPLT